MDGWDCKSLKALVLRAPLCGANNDYQLAVSHEHRGMMTSSTLTIFSVNWHISVQSLT